MTIRLIQVPYDSGHRAKRMGAGPLHLVARGAAGALRRVGEGADLRVIRIESAVAFPTEIGTAFELHRAVADAVASAVREGALAFVLSGNCNSSIGTVAGLQAAAPDEPVGVVWFDGHGDCNTPETFTGDFLDAMGLSTLTGRCWQALTQTLPHFSPVPDEHVALIGGHGMDAGAKSVLDGSGITNVSADTVQARGAEAALGPVLDRWREKGIQRVYVHLDVDVLDAKRVGPANEFAPTDGGLAVSDMLSVVDLIATSSRIMAASVASYDPSFDREDQVLTAALEFMRHIAS